MTKRGKSILRKGRQLYGNKQLYPEQHRLIQLMRFENELCSVVTGVKHKRPGQQGKMTWQSKRKEDNLQYMHYLYPFVQKIQQRDIVAMESRLDVVAYHLDWSKTKHSTRQDANHAHFVINGEKVNLPSYSLQVGDVIACKKALTYRKGFSKPYYSSFEVNHRIRTAIFLNPTLPSQTSLCNVRSR